MDVNPRLLSLKQLTKIGDVNELYSIQASEKTLTTIYETYESSFRSFQDLGERCSNNCSSGEDSSFEDEAFEQLRQLEEKISNGIHMKKHQRRERADKKVLLRARESQLRRRIFRLQRCNSSLLPATS
jgi:hypothetical protein